MENEAQKYNPFESNLSTNVKVFMLGHIGSVLGINADRIPEISDFEIIETFFDAMRVQIADYDPQLLNTEDAITIVTAFNIWDSKPQSWKQLFETLLEWNWLAPWGEIMAQALTINAERMRVESTYEPELVYGNFRTH